MSDLIMYLLLNIYMKEEINPVDYKEITETSDNGLDRESTIHQPNLKASLNALVYKSTVIQSRRWCSNICQIITPIICLLFTLFVRIIVEGITTGAIQSYDYPQPFNMPQVNNIMR